MTLGQRVAVIRDGRILQVAVAAHAVPAARQPVRGRVHRLAGDEPRRGDGRRRCRSQFGQFRVPLARRRRRRASRTRVVLGIRPEASRTPHSRRPGCRRSTSRVDVVEDVGADAYVHFRGRRAANHRGVARVGRTNATILAESSTLFTARVDPRTSRPSAALARARRRSCALPLLRRGDRREPRSTRPSPPGRRHVWSRPPRRRWRLRRRDEAERHPRTRARARRAARRRRGDPVRAPTQRRVRRLSPYIARSARRSRPRGLPRPPPRRRHVRERAEDRAGADDDLVHGGHAAAAA